MVARAATRVVAQGWPGCEADTQNTTTSGPHKAQLVQLNQQFLPRQDSMADLDKSSTLKTPSDQKTAN
ncbi:hypothetical protein IFM51744_04333 [Aspergillus udagawae]|uniref:Uncharacterized protein n=1 Tax=Aspergillus udagawae TaxID=91492 RepID=A0ABQ1AGE3_9EURO|nr:hypothetical protein IFM51744_04333 [Aspergillus udagawae]GFF81430.1 hypothetical protein IFM53868_03135 [Aspergillus udagawae]